MFGKKIRLKNPILWIFCIFFFCTPWCQASTYPNNDNRIKSIYDSNQNTMLWVKDGKLTTCGHQLIDVLSRVEEEGLNPENYSQILEEANSINLSSPENQLQLDKLLTFGAITYIADIKGDRIDPHKINKNFTIPRPHIDEVKRFTELFNEDPNCSWLSHLSPPHKEYQHLKTLLARYRQKKTQGGWPSLPKGTHLKLGMESSLVTILRAQLSAQDIPVEMPSNPRVFDPHLEIAVKRFQRTHGLDANGLVDPHTLKALNTSVDDRIKQIIITLERYRWLPEQFPARYILVNIAGFYLKAVKDHKTAFYMPVIIGRPYRKTPIFNAPLTEVIFNPSWHVPTKIATHDKLPLLKRNPSALIHKGYHVYDTQTGEEVNFNSVDWSDLSPSDFHYRLRQDPGSANALGKIRFTIVNPFSVYMHGTPETQLFAKADRSFSSGCIRVENPVKLAAFVLNDSLTWPKARIAKEASGTQTLHVKLDKPISVYITYLTVWEDEYHHFHFVDDIYDQDAQIWKVLNNRYAPSKELIVKAN